MYNKNILFYLNRVLFLKKFLSTWWTSLAHFMPCLRDPATSASTLVFRINIYFGINVHTCISMFSWFYLTLFNSSGKFGHTRIHFQHCLLCCKVSIFPTAPFSPHLHFPHSCEEIDFTSREPSRNFITAVTCLLNSSLTFYLLTYYKK